MKKKIVLIGLIVFLLIFIISVNATEVFNVGLRVKENKNDGFLQNTKGFLFDWLVEGVFTNKRDIDYGVKLVCEEECSVCEKCVSPEEYSKIYKQFNEGTLTQKPSLDDLKKTFSLLNVLSKSIQNLALEFTSYKFRDLFLITETPQVFFGQIRDNSPKGSGAEGPLEEDAIMIPFWKFPYSKSRIKMTILNTQEPTCMPDAECEKEKMICPEYSNKKRVDLYCNPKKYPNKYNCRNNEKGLCKSNNFIIEAINGIDLNTALKVCCQWAERLEYEKCKQETDLSIQEFGKKYFEGENYNGQRLTGKVTINFQNKGNPVSNSLHSGWNNIITLSGSPEEIDKDLIPGDIVSFIINKGFINEAPPWLYKGLSYTFASSGRDGKKCEYFKELVRIKDKIDLKKALGEWNQAEINDKDSLAGYALIELLMSKGPRYYEKDVYYQKFMLNIVYGAFKQKELGDRTWHAWENAIIKYPINSYDIESIEDAEVQLKNWINSQLGSNGEIYAKGVINPCTCIPREEFEVNTQTFSNPGNSVDIMDLPLPQ